MNTEIYLDANATSEVMPAALAAAHAMMRHQYGNPSSTHAAGLKARATLDAVRRRAQRLLGAGAGRLMFTSGATEAIQTAVLSALYALRERQARGEATGKLLLYGATEHKAVPESLAHWNRLLGTGLELRALPVDGAGRHRLDLLRALAPQVAMLCTMAANNETGAVSDLAAIEAVLRESASAAFWMVDSVQALGKLRLDLASSRIDYAPFSGHKLYAPKGVGMLYVREGAPYTALMMGGGQEAGQRSGTENMAGIAALGAVFEALEDGASFRPERELAAFRERLADALRLALPGVVFNAPFETSLPTTLNFSVPGLSARELLNLFDAAGVRLSSGSACSSAKPAPSYVLEAMGLPHWRCAAAVRMSFGPMADAAFIDAACQRIARCGDALRSAGLLPSAPAPERHDGLLQLGADGDCAWLLIDAASRSCIIVDPGQALAARIAALVRGQQLRVRAILATHHDPARAQARAGLLDALASQLDGAAGADTLGWPHDCRQVTLGNGAAADALALGTRLLARLPHFNGAGASYLLGEGGPDHLAADQVLFAFTGPAPIPGGVEPAMPVARLRSAVQGLAELVNRDTVLCQSAENANLSCTTLGAEGRAGGLLAELLAVQPRLARAALPAMDGVAHLAPGALEHFFATHPGALLVDVREPYEQAAGAAAAGGVHPALSVPLSRLAQHLPAWLRGEPRPLVFFCRSGNRSLMAARCLHRLGYQHAWSVLGGAALGA